MKFPRRLVTVGAALCGLGILLDAAAVVRRHDVPESAYSRLGQSAPYRSVGRVEVDYGDGFGFQWIGTATLIARDQLVSAAHVFDREALGGAQAARISFANGQRRDIDLARPGVVNLHPGYNSFTLANDVAVVFLRVPVAIPPAKIYAGRRVALGTTVTFVGFGITGNGFSGETVDIQSKRAGQNSLDRYAGRNFEVDFDAPGTSEFNAYGSPVALALEALIASGDSGGSVWVRTTGGHRIMGINSYGLDDYPDGLGNGIESDYGDISGFVYLPPYRGWIASLPRPAW